VHTHENSAGVDFDVMGSNRLEGGHAQGSTSSNVEPRAMARAFDLITLNFPFGQWSTIVRADVVDRKVLAVDVKEGHRSAADIQQSLAAGRNFGCHSNSDEFGHVSLLSCACRPIFRLIPRSFAARFLF